MGLPTGLPMGLSTGLAAVIPSWSESRFSASASEYESKSKSASAFATTLDRFDLDVLLVVMALAVFTPAAMTSAADWFAIAAAIVTLAVDLPEVP